MTKSKKSNVLKMQQYNDGDSIKLDVRNQNELKELLQQRQFLDMQMKLLEKDFQLFTASVLRSNKITKENARIDINMSDLSSVIYRDKEDKS